MQAVDLSQYSKEQLSNPSFLLANPEVSMELDRVAQAQAQQLEAALQARTFGEGLTETQIQLLTEYDKANPPQGAPPVPPDGIVPELASAMAKMDAGTPFEELSPEEQALIAAELQKPVIELPTKTYKVGGKEIQFQDALAELQAELGEPLPDTLSAKQLEKLVDQHITVKNKDEWSRANTNAAQANARQKREISSAAQRMIEASTRVSDQLKETREVYEEVKALASKDVSSIRVFVPDPTDPTQNVYDASKQFEINRILEAKTNLPKIQAKIERLEQEAAQTDRSLIRQQYLDFFEENPQYKTSMDFDTINLFLHPKSPSYNPTAVPQEDREKFMEANEIISHANRNGYTPNDTYDLWLKQGKVIYKPKQTAPGTVPVSPVNTTGKDTKAILAEIRKRQKNANPILPGGAAPQQPVKKTMKQLEKEALVFSTNSAGAGKAGSITRDSKDPVY